MDLLDYSAIFLSLSLSFFLYFILSCSQLSLSLSTFSFCLPLCLLSSLVHSLSFSSRRKSFEIKFISFQNLVSTEKPVVRKNRDPDFVRQPDMMSVRFCCPPPTFLRFCPFRSDAYFAECPSVFDEIGISRQLEPICWNIGDCGSCADSPKTSGRFQ